jgi:hypothetical protein
VKTDSGSFGTAAMIRILRMTLFPVKQVNIAARGSDR